MASITGNLIEQVKIGSGATASIASTAYGECSTGAAVVAKTVEMTGFVLTKGVTIHVKFTESNSAENPTLSVNGTTAKAITRYGTIAAGTSTKASWQAGAVISFTYDGTSWVMNDWLNDDTTYSAFKGATSSANGGTGLVPAPTSAQVGMYLKADGSWATPTNTQYEFADNYAANSNKGATVATVTNAINALDVTGASSIGKGKTIASWSETDGKVSITTQDIQITKSQISDFPTSMTPASHTHGNVGGTGNISGTGVTAASGDSLLIADSSNSGKLEKGPAFGTDATKFLNNKGEWVNPVANLASALIYKGTVSSTSALPTQPKVGDVYKVAEAGTYGGHKCEVGDTLICNTAAVMNGTTVTTAAVWQAVQTNVDGVVTGPSASTDNAVAIFDGTTGKVIKNSSYTIGKSVPSTAVFTDRYVNSASFADDATNKNLKMTLTRTGSDTSTVTANLPKFSTSTAGVVPKPASGDTGKFLKGDGTWATPTNTQYQANTSNLVLTTVPNITSVGSATTTTNTTVKQITGGSNGTCNITDAVLTIAWPSWTTGDATFKTVNSAGSAPTLGTAITVATGSISADGTGAAVATGISTK